MSTLTIDDVLDVLAEAYNWIDNGKCLWESQEAANELLDKMQAVLTEAGKL